MPSMLSRIGSVLTPILAFAGLFAGVELDRPSWLGVPVPRAVASAPRPTPGGAARAHLPVKESVLGFLDMRDGMPSLSAKLGDPLEVSGWTVCSVQGSTLVNVNILVNGIKRAEVKEFFPRPDVAAAFGRPDFEMSGWKATVWLGGLKPGEYTLTAQGEGSRGEKGTLPAFRLTIME